MGYQLMGGALIVASCGGYGLSLAAGYRQRERETRGLLDAVCYMENQLAYALTPLPELCHQAGREAGGRAGAVLRQLARELERQTAPDVQGCMKAALDASPELPAALRGELMRLGRSLGRFDLPGQLRGLAAVGEDCRGQLEALRENREPRLRSYQTLGLCAGAALAILLL